MILTFVELTKVIKNAYVSVTNMKINSIKISRWQSSTDLIYDDAKTISERERERERGMRYETSGWVRKRRRSSGSEEIMVAEWPARIVRPAVRITARLKVTTEA